MNWEALSAVSTALTTVIVAVAAYAAFREVRLTAASARAAGEQISELRKATQFEGTLEVFKELDSLQQIEARRFVHFDLPALLEDQAYRDEIALLTAADETRHLELTVLRCFERIGFYVANGYVERDLVYLVASGRIVIMFENLKSVMEIHRIALGGAMHPWQSFERLYNETMAHMRGRGFDTGDLSERIQQGRKAGRR